MLYSWRTYQILDRLKNKRSYYGWNNPYFTRIMENMDTMLGTYHIWDKSYYEYKKLVNRRKASKARYSKYLRFLFESFYELKYLTFTFDDNSLQFKNKKRLVKSWLDLNAKDYLCNVDFGDKNGRIHFHAVVAPKNNCFTFQYGYLHVRDVDRRLNKITSYSNKLVNHAHKDTSGLWFHPRSKNGLKPVDKIPF